MGRNNDNSKFFQIIGSTDANGNITGLTVSANLVSGNASLGNTATANYLTGTLTTAAQPNITSVGTLSSLSVTANVTANNFVATTLVKVGVVTVSNLPNANVGAGSRAFVSDANTTTFAAIVGGSGSNNVPVYSDGTDWRVG